MVLGGLNSFVILTLVPYWGGDVTFLREVPHAKISSVLMVPWFIMGIASLVELNFRGFLLGRIHTLVMKWMQTPSLSSKYRPWVVPVAGSAFVFSFDPFMVSTFRHLHWIAVWDGVVWGMLWARQRNLYTVIVAHGVEVIMVYLSVKQALEGGG